MNDKLRSILHNAWNEPRHFFFWLALFSICGFAAVAVGFVAVNTSLTSPTLLLAFVALGCILCFLVSVPAYILAWIPPVRRLFSWLLLRWFLVLACLVTLVALFYAVEDWRGRQSWQTYKRAWEAKGERFDMASFVPPPVPDEQNFFETPLWQDLRWAATNRATPWSDADEQHRAVFTVYGLSDWNGPSTGSWTKAQRVDLAAWQGFYRGSSNDVQAAQQAFRRRYGLGPAQTNPPTNYFPVAEAPQSPAADVLLALSKFSENRQLLIASSTRPYARFWANYDAGPGMLLPHLGRLKACSQYLSLHGSAALKAGDRETAVADLKALFRLLDSIQREPTLISQLVRIAVLQIALQPVWEGLADRRWTAADLSVIERELGKLDFLADYGSFIRGERAHCELWALDYIRKAGISGLDDMFAPKQGSEHAVFGKFLGMALFRLIPAGWFDQNKVSLCRLLENYMLPVVDLQRRVVSPAAAAQSQSVLEHQRLRPYDVFSRMLLPGLARSAERFAYGQTSTDLARVACALERYRLVNGQFPDTLDALSPKFIENLPHDLITGQPLIYRRTDDGRFVLYSVGWNETDDSGTVELRKSGNADVNKGDWVWRYPAG